MTKKPIVNKCIPKDAKKDDPERKELTAQIEGDLTYSREVYINEVRFYLQRTADSMIEAGKRLLILQEKEGHGEFIKIVEEEIGIPKTSAYRFMNAALKSEKYPRIDFSQFGRNVSKIYTLLEAPEEELIKFEQLGLFAGKDADELMAMSHKDLRGLVKSLRTEADKIIQKEVGSTRAENKTLQQEIERLHSMVPNGPDASWAQQALMDVEELFMRIEDRLSSFAFDPRMVGNDKLKSQVDGFYKRLESRFLFFVDKWQEYTGQRVAS